jgi:hypothetical protein
MLDFLFGSKNLTKDWQRTNDLRLTFDLDSGRLNGVGLGERLDRLSCLGPVEDRSGLPSEYRYFSLGLSVDCYNKEDAIDSLEIIQKDQDVPQYCPFPGGVHYRGENLDLGQLTQKSFLGRFGPPFWKDEDDEEVIFFYEFPDREWQVEFAPDGTLNRIIVTSKPLMADERQRNAYGVNKPWPPTS